MKQAQIQLRQGEGRFLKSGGLWIYSNEIAKADAAAANGGIVQVLDFDSFFLGYGFYNACSTIAVRMLSRKKEHAVTDAFLYKRVKDAWEYRKAVTDTECCRVIFGEADFLPGIVVDKFSDVLVVESLALGIDRLKPTILNALKEVLAADGVHVRGIYERSDAKVRHLEGMQPYSGFIGEPFDTLVPICENGVRYLVDVKDGQKTGFFLDQKYNRLAVQRLCKNAGVQRVLDCFTHTGSFALNAGLAGVRDVLGVDASALAIAQATQNAQRNGLQDTVRFTCADVFSLLPALENEGEKFDLVVLDPPAFTKSRDSVKNAVRGYREINLRGMRLCKNGGYLATCSCSHFMHPELFTKTVAQAAKDAHKRLRQIEYRTQSPDHPILWMTMPFSRGTGPKHTGKHDKQLLLQSSPELDTKLSYYLKFYIFQVFDEQ